jgi:hypothetical protein
MNNYTFIKNDETSFHAKSRVYEVYNYNKSRSLRTAIVIGYDPCLEKYFITLLGESPLLYNYSLEYSDFGTTEVLNILKEFFDILPLLSPEDFIADKSYTIEALPSLIKENFVYYVSDVEPYYMEENDEYEGIYSTTDEHATFMLDESYLIPVTIEDFDTEEYLDYGFDRVMNIFYKTDSEMSLYCDINFDLLEKQMI